MPDTFDPQTVKRPGWIAKMRSNFLTGLVIIAPIGLTFWLIWTVVGWIDGFVLPLVPDAYQPDRYIQQLLGRNSDQQFDMSGLGVVVFLIFTMFIGWIGKGFIGRSMLRSAENLVNRMPVIRSIYGGVKQIAETVFSQRDNSFEKACLVEYPRKGAWAIGFIATTAKGEVASISSEDDPLISVFIPTTPNPTSGFLLFYPDSEVHQLDMSVEDAAKLVISAGLVYPQDKPKSDV